jgi:integrase
MDRYLRVPLSGHTSISITLDTYTHVIEGMDGGLTDAMDDTP